MRRNLFLYLTLACFFGLIVIFIVDGYMGVYDTVYVTSGERPEKIEADFWLRQGRAAPAGMENSYYISSADRDEKVFFRYEVANRRFSGYTADIEVAVWHNQEKVHDVISQPISIEAFDEGQAEWVIDATELLPEALPPEQSYEYTVIIKRGEIERKIIMRINQRAYPPESPIRPVPVPVPPPPR
ncbi:hypothetical protein ACFLWS_04390 [Chloroflexota bacterium]